MLGACTVYTHPGYVRTGADVRVQARVHTPTYVTIAEPPPPPQVVSVRSASPSASSVWVAGYWKWSGRWEWQAGGWVEGTPGHTWEPPVCVAVDGGGYQYHEGYWRPTHQAPPTVYRTPGTIQVHATTPGVQPVVQRVVVRRGQRPQATVVVAPTRPSGQSQTVVVRAPTQPATVRPRQPTQPVTVRPTQPARPTQPTQVGTRPTTTVTARPNQPVTVQPRPSRPTTVVTPTRPRTAQGTTTQGTTVTVRPAAQGTTTQGTTVRATPAVQGTRTTGATVRATPAVRGTTTTGTTARATPAVQGTTTTGTTVRATPTVRGTVATGVSPTQRPVAVGTTARGTVATASVQCAPVITRVPRGSRVVLRGTGLRRVRQVRVGGNMAGIIRASDTELTVGINGSGPIRVTLDNNQQVNCGSVSVF